MAIENRNMPNSKISARSSNTNEITKPTKDTHKKNTNSFCKFSFSCFIDRNKSNKDKQESNYGITQKTKT